MTRPKSVRRAQKDPFANETPLRRAWVRFSPEYAAEFGLFETPSGALLQILWEPNLPPKEILASFSSKLEQEKAPFIEQSLQHFGLIGEEA